MKQNLSRTERILRSGLGLVVVAVGVYGVFVNLWLGLFILGVGIFTVYEGYAGWTLVAVLTESWVKPEGGSLEMPGIMKGKKPATEKTE
jgi:Inner membrane protein YgaP-like, transmembrane domain